MKNNLIKQFNHVVVEEYYNTKKNGYDLSISIKEAFGWKSLILGSVKTTKILLEQIENNKNDIIKAVDYISGLLEIKPVNGSGNNVKPADNKKELSMVLNSDFFKSLNKKQQKLLLSKQFGIEF